MNRSICSPGPVLCLALCLGVAWFATPPSPAAAQAEPGGELTYDDLRALAKEHTRLREYEKAIMTLKLAEPLAPNRHHRARLLTTQARCYWFMKDYEAGHETIETALATENLSGNATAKALLMRGDLYRGQRDFEQAVASYEKVQEIEKVVAGNFVDSLIGAGRAYLDMRAFGKALESLEDAQDHPEAKPEQRMYAIFFLGSLYSRTGKNDLAREMYQQVIDFDHNLPNLKKNAQVRMDKLPQ